MKMTVVATGSTAVVNAVVEGNFYNKTLIGEDMTLRFSLDISKAKKGEFVYQLENLTEWVSIDTSFNMFKEGVIFQG